MPNETELKLSPEERQSEKEIRKSAKLGFALRQCYLAACGDRAPNWIQITKEDGNRYLEIRRPGKSGKRRKHFWRCKLSGNAWERIKNGEEALRVRRSEVILGRGIGKVFYSLTIKEEHVGCPRRHEWEGSIPRWAFRRLWKFGTRDEATRRPVRKRRYYVEDRGRLLHVDFFTRRLRQLVLIEIEFPRLRKAKRFRKKHGEKGKNGLIFTRLPSCIRGKCRDVTAEKLAGCRTLSGEKRAPSFW